MMVTMVVSAGVTVLIGAAKEVYYDYKLGRGTPDWRDMAANCIGVATSTIIILMGEMI
jgi:hypothetical protein